MSERVDKVRYFEATDVHLGVGEEGGSWWVYERHTNETWALHCGPYPSKEDAEQWIKDIREEP